MIADSFYEQGVSHDVCQDYAVSDGRQYGIISDGCSNGGGERIDTDWGARILSKTAEEGLKMLENGMADPKEFIFNVAEHAADRANEFSMLAPSCMLATLGIVLSCNNDKTLGTLLLGDGVEGARRRDGKWEIKVYEPVSRGCFYLSYTMFDGQLDMYFDRYKGNYKITKYVGDLSKPSEMVVTQEEALLTKDKLYFASEYPVGDYDMSFIGSDGLSSFFKKVNTGTSKHNEPVSVAEVLSVLLDVQKCRPGFMRLQRNWAFKRPIAGTFVKREWRNSDDVSMGVIDVGY